MRSVSKVTLRVSFEFFKNALEIKLEVLKSHIIWFIPSCMGIISYAFHFVEVNIYDIWLLCCIKNKIYGNIPIVIIILIAIKIIPDFICLPPSFDFPHVHFKSSLQNFCPFFSIVTLRIAIIYKSDQTIYIKNKPIKSHTVQND